MVKTLLTFEYHDFIWQVLPQLRCDWKYLTGILKDLKISPCVEIIERSFSNTTRYHHHQNSKYFYCHA